MPSKLETLIESLRASTWEPEPEVAADPPNRGADSRNPKLATGNFETSAMGEKNLATTTDHSSDGSSPEKNPEPILADEAPLRRCYACSSDTFWCSVHGPVICSNCHPPASDSLVAGTLWVGETWEEWAARLCRKAKRQ